MNKQHTKTANNNNNVPV